MKVEKLDEYFRSILDMESVEKSDASLNGLQVAAAEADIQKAVFAVDACMETFRRAVERGADLLFVHHGLFWGKPSPITKSHYERIRFLMENDLALYAAHLPLDMHPVYGNNAGLVEELGLERVEAFGELHGVAIGFKGAFPKYLDLDEVLARLGLSRESALGVLPFGPDTIEKVAVVSGGAEKLVGEALDWGADLYITGELSHEVYHTCQEGKIHLLAGGHYFTETYGPKLMAEKTAGDTDVETEFVDVPTGL